MLILEFLVLFLKGRYVSSIRNVSQDNFFENIIRGKGFLGEFYYLNNDRAIFPTKSHSNLSQMSQNVEYNVLYVPQRGEMKNDFWLWLSIFSLGRISENAKKQYNTQKKYNAKVHMYVRWFFGGEEEEVWYLPIQSFLLPQKNGMLYSSNFQLASEKRNEVSKRRSIPLDMNTEEDGSKRRSSRDRQTDRYALLSMSQGFACLPCTHFLVFLLGIIFSSKCVAKTLAWPWLKTFCTRREVPNSTVQYRMAREHNMEMSIILLCYFSLLNIQLKGIPIPETQRLFYIENTAQELL